MPAPQRDVTKRRRFAALFPIAHQRVSPLSKVIEFQPKASGAKFLQTVRKLCERGSRTRKSGRAFASSDRSEPEKSSKTEFCATFFGLVGSFRTLCLIYANKADLRDEINSSRKAACARFDRAARLSSGRAGRRRSSQSSRRARDSRTQGPHLNPTSH
jgi:hypothetical protein